MAGGFIHFFLGDVRRFHLHITGGKFRFLGQFFQLFGNRRAFWQPERQAGPDIFRVDRKQPHFLTDLAMIAFLGFIEHFEIFVELGSVLERCTVDTLELRVLFVAFVIRAGHGGELERADVAGAHHVLRAPFAKINEVAVLAVGDPFTFGNAFEIADLKFTRITRSLNETAQASALCVLHRLFACDNDFLERVVRFDFLFHLGLDCREIFG